MPPPFNLRLDRRLQAVANRIEAKVHADIGSDHGKLLAALLASRRIERGIAIENKIAPHDNSRRALAPFDCDVRLGDGLEVLRPGEADSLSICGMGGVTMVQILVPHPERIPESVVLQPNRSTDLVRRWGYEHQYHLIDEQIVRAPRPYDVLLFQRKRSLPDPAYRDLDLELGFVFGPWNLRRWQAPLQTQLRAELEYLQQLKRLSVESRQRMRLIERALKRFGERE